MKTNKSASLKTDNKGFSLHLPDKALTEKELAARFENLRKLIAEAKSLAGQKTVKA